MPSRSSTATAGPTSRAAYPSTTIEAATRRSELPDQVPTASTRDRAADTGSAPSPGPPQSRSAGSPSASVAPRPSSALVVPARAIAAATSPDGTDESPLYGPG